MDFRKILVSNRFKFGLLNQFNINLKTKKHEKVLCKSK
jgi:hypothetical protein